MILVTPRFLNVVIKLQCSNWPLKFSSFKQWRLRERQVSEKLRSTFTAATGIITSRRDAAASFDKFSASSCHILVRFSRKAENFDFFSFSMFVIRSYFVENERVMCLIFTGRISGDMHKSEVH